jgi:hypothetical protein
VRSAGSGRDFMRFRIDPIEHFENLSPLVNPKLSCICLQLIQLFRSIVPVTHSEGLNHGE